MNRTCFFLKSQGKVPRASPQQPSYPRMGFVHPAAQCEKVDKGEAPHYPQVAIIVATESWTVCNFAG